MKRILLLTCLFVVVTAVEGFAQRYMVFPHFASGSGWSCDLFLSNPGSSTVSGITVSFLGDTGAPLTVESNLGTASSFSVTLGPGAMQVIRISASGTLRVGYIVLSIPGLAPVLATEIFRYEQSGTVLAELGVPQQSPDRNFTFPVEIDSARGINTGVAFANPTYSPGTSLAQTIVVNLIQSDGTLRQTATVPLGAGEHRALYLNEPGLFGGLDSFTGSASVSGPRLFQALALRQDKQAFGAVSVDSGPVLAPFVVSGTAVPETEPNNTTAQAQAISGNVLITGSISSNGDADYFQFSGKQNDLISAVVDTQGLGSAMDSVLRLEKPDGSIVAQNDQNGLFAQNDSFVQTMLPADGTYYFRVTDYRGQGGANYTYRLHARLPGGGSTPPARPQINSINPLSVSQGSTTQIVIQGSNLTGVTSINFNPSTGLTVTNIQSTATQVTFQLAVAADASVSNRTVTVTTPAGTSNVFGFDITGGGSGQNLDGTWSGTTSQGKSISITVSGGRITGVSFSGQISGSGCSSQFDTTTTGLSRAITNNTFSFTVTGGPGGVSYTISGTFTSGTQANGTLSMTLNSIPGVPSCSGSASVTWDATKS